MIDINSTEGIIFLSYLTRYNIAEIYNILNLQEHNYFEIEYLANKVDKSLPKRIQEALKTTEITVEKLRYHQIQAIPFFDVNYPIGLKKLKDAPPILYVRGKLKNMHFTAIVGSRKASPIASDSVMEIAETFHHYKFGIVSGLALGIDEYAHSAALKLKGYTAAILPTSLDNIYPLENYGLANRILESEGVLISEIPIGINRGKMSFIERNRLQTGISDFTIPVEMGVNSGTMHTVNFCIQQSKKLLIPIPPKEVLDKYQPFYDGIIHLRDKYKD
ncbi:MAG: DNA-processing protein DprA, partial [Flavobacterium sp.]